MYKAILILTIFLTQIGCQTIDRQTASESDIVQIGSGDLKISVEDNPNTQLLLKKPTEIPKFVSLCEIAGVEKIKKQAEAYGIEVDLNSLRVSGVSVRKVLLRTVAEYVWWTVDVIDAKNRTDLFANNSKMELTKLTQRSGASCF